MWFRRDLRLADNPALNAAVQAGDDVVPVVVLDPHLSETYGPGWMAFLYGCLRDLDESMDGRLVVRSGSPVRAIPELAKEVDATKIFCTEDFMPYGRRRDDEVAQALVQNGMVLERVDSPYAVAPGSILKTNATPYRVFTPYLRAWESHGAGLPGPAPTDPQWAKAESETVPPDPAFDGSLPAPGERAALRQVAGWVDSDADDYGAHRNDPGSDATSRMSPYLRFGCIHPRQILDGLSSSSGAQKYRSEVAWRDFYADVLFHNPESLERPLQPQMSNMAVDEGVDADRRFDAWSQGRTGYPLVDAGMRQLLGQAWVHNRVRMIVASFLVKDLHLDWTRGARWFEKHLVDADPASNTHGWQWVAGTGTDPSPYYRIFNPVTQAKKFDPDGVYVRRWVPELSEIADGFIHEPWKSPNGVPTGYVEPIVDHARERTEALRRYSEVRS